ncbi:MAG: hypothetical protein AAGA31_18290 [Bacteroidota bacterium]
MQLPHIKVYLSYARKGQEYGINDAVDRLAQLKTEQDGKAPEAKDYELSYWYDPHLIYRDGTHWVYTELWEADIIVILHNSDYLRDPYIDEFERPVIESAAEDPNRRVLLLLHDPVDMALTWTGELPVATLPENPARTFYDQVKPPLWRTFERQLTAFCEELAAEKRLIAASLTALIPSTPPPTELMPVAEEDNTPVSGPGTYLGLVAILVAIGMYAAFLYRSSPSTPVSTSLPIALEYNSLLPRSGQATRNYFVSAPTTPSSNRSVTPTTYSSTNQVASASRTEGVSAKSYGRYDSCQGRDSQGNRPCKLNRRWYIVNEARGIHHLIDLPASTHKDIFAIRPFREGLAEVFFFDGRQMYLEFCLDLNDRVIDCKLVA